MFAILHGGIEWFEDHLIPSSVLITFILWLYELCPDTVTIGGLIQAAVMAAVGTVFTFWVVILFLWIALISLTFTLEMVEDFFD